MYCKLLEEAVEKLQKGEQPETEERPDPLINLHAEAYIDGGYIDDAMHKIEIYQRIAAIRTNQEVRELLDELIDRFGEPTKPVMRLLSIARIKNYARDLWLRSVSEQPQALDFSLCEGHKLPVQALVRLDKVFGRRMQALGGKGYRFAIGAKEKENITNCATYILMLMAGDEEALEKAGLHGEQQKEAV